MKHVFILIALLLSLGSASAQVIGQDGTYYGAIPDVSHDVDAVKVVTIPHWRPPTQSDEYPTIYNTSIRITQPHACTLSVITPYPTLTNEATGRTITLLPQPIDSYGYLWYSAPTPGGYYTITMYTSGHVSLYTANVAPRGRPKVFKQFWGDCGYNVRYDNPQPFRSP
jgi:hypothetical protein